MPALITLQIKIKTLETLTIDRQVTHNRIIHEITFDRTIHKIDSRRTLLEIELHKIIHKTDIKTPTNKIGPNITIKNTRAAHLFQEIMEIKIFTIIIRVDIILIIIIIQEIQIITNLTEGKNDYQLKITITHNKFQNLIFYIPQIFFQSMVF